MCSILSLCFICMMLFFCSIGIMSILSMCIWICLVSIGLLSRRRILLFMSRFGLSVEVDGSVCWLSSVMSCLIFCVLILLMVCIRVLLLRCDLRSMLMVCWCMRFMVFFGCLIGCCCVGLFD